MINVEGDIDHVGVIVGAAHQRQHMAVGIEQHGKIGTSSTVRDALRIVIITVTAHSNGGYHPAMGQQARQKPGILKGTAFGEETMVKEATTEHLIKA